MGPTGTSAMGPTGTPAIGPTGTPAIGPTGTPAVGPTGASVEAPPPPAPPTPQPVASGDVSRRAILSPVVRRLAAEHDVDLELVPGSGDGGRITRKDVERYIASEPAIPSIAAPIPEPPIEVTTVPAPSPTPEPEVEAPAPDPAPEPIVEATPAAATPVTTAVTMDEALVTPTKVTITAGAGDEVVEIPRLRRTIADHMIHAKRTAAHVWTSIEVDYEQVEHVRAAHRDRF